MNKLQKTEFLGILGYLGLILSGFLPWVSFYGYIDGSHAYMYGNGGNYFFGWLVAFCGIIGLITLIYGYYYSNKKVTSIWMILFSMASFIILGWFASIIEWGLTEDMVSIRPASGLILGFICAFILFLDGIVLGTSKSEERDKKDKYVEKKERYCPECGREIPWDAEVCPYCEKQLPGTILPLQYENTRDENIQDNTYEQKIQLDKSSRLKVKNKIKTKKMDVKIKSILIIIIISLIFVSIFMCYSLLLNSNNTSDSVSYFQFSGNVTNSYIDAPKIKVDIEIFSQDNEWNYSTTIDNNSIWINNMNVIPFNFTIKGGYNYYRVETSWYYLSGTLGEKEIFNLNNLNNEDVFLNIEITKEEIVYSLI